MTVYHELRIIQIIPETADSKTFVLEPLDRGLKDYEAGQFITLVFQTAHGEKRRSYSFSSSPSLNEPMSITIKKVDNGEFSRQLLDHAQVGNLLQASSINGLFTLPKKMDGVEQVFFFAAGSGITPCFSLIKTLLETTRNKVVLVYSNKHPQLAIFYRQLVELQEKHTERLHIEFLFSSNVSVYSSRLSSWLLQHLLKEYLHTEKSKALFYLCGPFEYMQTVTITLLGEGIPSHNIKKENFSSLPRMEKPVPPDTDAHRVSIRFQDKDYELTVQYPNSILAVAKSNNVPIPYSCEAGRCGSCAATCIIGNVWMAYNEVLLDDEVAKGRILCCQAFPIGGDVGIAFKTTGYQ